MMPSLVAMPSIHRRKRHLLVVLLWLLGARKSFLSLAFCPSFCAIHHKRRFSETTGVLVSLQGLREKLLATNARRRAETGRSLRGSMRAGGRTRGRKRPGPRAMATTSSPPDDATVTQDHSGKYRLMLVDDEQSLRRAVSEYLEQRGYSVEALASASEALEALRGGGPYSGPDLIISDINMPGMNGFQFLEALRSGGARESSIPVVFLTARGMTTDRIQGYRAGVNAYLSKPFDPEELVSIVDNVILNQAKAYELAAAEAAEAAQLVPVRSASGEDSAVDSGDTGGSSELLEDVRRELGDIKALLLADRAQRRESGVRSNDGPRNTSGPRLLTSSKGGPPVARAFPLREAGAPTESSPPWVGGGFSGGEDAIDMPSVLLSVRERAVLVYVLRGYTNREIASALNVSVRAIEKHVSNMLAKTGTSNRTELVRYSLRERLVREDD